MKNRVNINKHKISIVTFPLDKARVTPLSNLLGIPRCLTSQCYIIKGNAGTGVAHRFGEYHFELIDYASRSSLATKICSYGKTQLTITFRTAKLLKCVDTWIFPILWRNFASATLIRATPTVIADEMTGHVMENNSPECITENVIQALNAPDLERITENGRQFVAENILFGSTVYVEALGSRS